MILIPGVNAQPEFVINYLLYHWINLFIYPQHSKPVSATISCRPLIKRQFPVAKHTSCDIFLLQRQKNNFIFFAKLQKLPDFEGYLMKLHCLNTLILTFQHSIR